MIKQITFVILALAFAMQAYGRGSSPQPPGGGGDGGGDRWGHGGNGQVLRYNIVVHPDVANVADNVLLPALNFVSSIGTDLGFLIFADEGPVDFTIEITGTLHARQKSIAFPDVDLVEVQRRMALASPPIDIETDARTLMLPGQGGSHIVLQLMMDAIVIELSRDGTLSRRQDAVVRTVTALAREIFGRISHYLKHKAIYESLPHLGQKRAADELRNANLRAAEFAVAFLQEVLVRREHLSHKFKTDFNQALERERQSLAALRQWDRLSKTLKPLTTGTGYSSNILSLPKTACMDIFAPAN